MWAASQFAVKGYFDTRLPGQSYFGAEPVALAVNADGSRLYVANMASDAVAVIDTAQAHARKQRSEGMVEPIGFVPTEWMPMSMAFIAFARRAASCTSRRQRAREPGPNNFPQPADRELRAAAACTRPIDLHWHAALWFAGHARCTPTSRRICPQWTDDRAESNRMKAAAGEDCFAGGDASRIKHVIYIIKENRTYDQILGDLKKDGKPVGNGDPKPDDVRRRRSRPTCTSWRCSSACSTTSSTRAKCRATGTCGPMPPSARTIWRRPGSRAYRGGQRTYDFEGVVADGYPLLQKIPDVNEPASGYLWGNLAAHGKTYYHFGEFISTTFCDEAAVADPQLGPMLAGRRLRAQGRLRRARRCPRSGAAA